MAKLYFRYGAMGSSKTANAIMVRHNYLERGQRVLMLKPRVDSRDGATMVASRSGLSCECQFIEDLDRFNVRDYDCLIVDEAQFLSRAQVERLVRVVDVDNVPVIPTGCAATLETSCSRAVSGCWPGPTPSRRSRPSAGAAKKPSATRASSTARWRARASRSSWAAARAM